MATNLPALRPNCVTVAELAAMFDLQTTAVYTDIKAGCPVERMGSPGPGDPTLVHIGTWHRWRVERARRDKRYDGAVGNAGSDPKDRMLEATASKREVELLKMLGELYPIADFSPLIADKLVTLRTAVLGVEERIHEIVGAEAARMVQDILIEAMNSAADALQVVPEELGQQDANA